MSVTLEGRAPYEKVLAYNSVIVEDGTKFSKTGFMIKFDEASEKLGSDAIRYLFAGANVSSDVRFGYSLGEEARRKLLSFYNSYVFFMTYASLENPEIEDFDYKNLTNPTDLWLMHRVNSFIKSARESYENYRTAEVVKAFEEYMEDLSNWYIRINRRRFWKEDPSQDKRAAYFSLYTALKTAIMMMSPIIPFMTEYMWQEMVKVFEKNSAESVHLCNWPCEFELEQSEILEDTKLVRKAIALSLKLRNEKQLKVKQPLSKLYLLANDREKAAITTLLSTVKEELNVKEVVFLKDFSQLSVRYLAFDLKIAGRVYKERAQELKKYFDEADADTMKDMLAKYDSCGYVKVHDLSIENEYLTLKTRYMEHIAVAELEGFMVGLDTLLNEELYSEGLYRELLRHCQVLRKEAGIRVEQKIVLGLSSEEAVALKVIEKYKKEIAAESLAVEIVEKAAAPLIERMVEVGENEVLVTIGLK